MELQPQDNKSLQIGLITESAVSENRMPLDAVTESINFHFDKIGSATLRKGTTRLGQQLSGNCLGLYEFRDSGSGTNNQITAVFGTDFYYLSGSTWTSRRSGLTASSKARFTTFLDFLWMVNGADATAIWNGAPGTAFSTSGNASGAPIGKFIENYRSRVWIAGNSNYPDRVYFSSLPSAEATPVITWDTDVATGNWIDISPSDGDNITGLKRSKNALVVFKQNHIYRIYSVAETEPDPKINVGTYSNESIVETKDGLYFHHPTGFYSLNENGAQEISKPIIDIVNAITVANYSKVCGWQDGDHVYWSVGDVTIGDVTYTDLTVRYTISTQTWTHYQYPQQFLMKSEYNDGTTLFRLVGDNNGNVLKVNVGNTDNGTPINYSLIHSWQSLDGLLSTRKNLGKMLFSHDKGSGTIVQWQQRGDLSNDWSKSLSGQFKNIDTVFNSLDVFGHKVRFRITGTSTGEPFEYRGYEILDTDSEEIVS